MSYIHFLSFSPPTTHGQDDSAIKYYTTAVFATVIFVYSYILTQMSTTLIQTRVNEHLVCSYKSALIIINKFNIVTIRLLQPESRFRALVIFYNMGQFVLSNRLHGPRGIACRRCRSRELQKQNKNIKLGQSVIR